MQRVINAADPAITTNNGVPPVTVSVPDLSQFNLDCSGGAIRFRNRTWVGYYFDHFSDHRVAYYEQFPANNNDRLKLLKLLKRGDLLRYTNASGNDIHIAIFYSRRWGESEYNKPGVNYDIIHAFGVNGYDDDGNSTTPPVFSRKVVVTGNDISTPAGFGRIRLW